MQSIKKSHLLRVISFACILGLLIGHTSIVKAKESSTKFVLTAEEQAYLDGLRANPITISYSYELVNTKFNEEPYGMLGPVLDVLRNELGLTVNLIKTNWHDAFIQVENGEVDFYGPIAISEARRQKYITVDPFYRSYSKIITRVDNPVNSMLGLYNRSIGLLEGSVITRTMQVYLGPKGKTIYYPTMEDMITGLREGAIEAFATVDNAEFEIFQYEDIQFEFSIDNYFVEQGFISGNAQMRPLAALLNRYMSENPVISDEITARRNAALIRYTRESFAREIEYLQETYSEILMFAEAILYPLCYKENGVVKGMQTEINDIFTQLTGIPIRFVSNEEFPNGVLSAIEMLTSGVCLAAVGAYYSIDACNNPEIAYSPLLWSDTIRTYSHYDNDGGLEGKRLGTTPFAMDYLGWNNTTGNTPKIDGSRQKLLNALKSGEIEAVYISDMTFNYEYSIRGDYSLREVEGLSAKAIMYMMYGAQNTEFNALYNKAMNLYHIINPQALSEWRTQSDKYKSDNMRIRHNQQILATIIIIVFIIMLATIIYLFILNLKAHRNTKNRLVDALDKVHYDELTGIYNRRYLEESLSKSIMSLSRSGGMLSVMMLDVDFFKKFNDTYGHSEGDACLRFIAVAIKNTLSRTDDYVARFGGEEFAVVLPNTDESGARVMANRILENVRACNIPHEKSTVTNHVTISIGVTTGIVEHTHISSDYIKQADEALYMSKQNGRDRYTFLDFARKSDDTAQQHNI